VVAGILFGIALVSFVGRISIRLFTQRRLYTDDGFLVVALACLCAGTVMLYERIEIIYLTSAVLQNNHTALQIAVQMDNFYDPKWQCYIFTLWTTVFAVKWCYFAFFHPFLQAMSNWKCFIFYYRFSICFSVVSWLFAAIGTELISCTRARRISVLCKSSSKRFSS
jgi:hypothetical protein